MVARAMTNMKSTEVVQRTVRTYGTVAGRSLRTVPWEKSGEMCRAFHYTHSTVHNMMMMKHYVHTLQ
jgi:hypothetical protein